MASLEEGCPNNGILHSISNTVTFDTTYHWKCSSQLMALLTFTKPALDLSIRAQNKTSKQQQPLSIPFIWNTRSGGTLGEGGGEGGGAPHRLFLNSNNSNILFDIKIRILNIAKRGFIDIRENARLLSSMLPPWKGMELTTTLLIILLGNCPSLGCGSYNL